MTKRGQKFGKVLFVSMLLTLTIALGGCAGDKEEEARLAFRLRGIRS